MKKHTAILVDDELRARQALKHKLNQHLSEIEIVSDTSDPQEALRLIATQKPDLLFLDIEMPQMSGFDLLDKLKDFDGSIIFVTAFDEYAIKAFKYSAVGYLLKPIDTTDLIQTVKSALAKKDQSKNSLARLFTYIQNNNPSQKKISVVSLSGTDFINIQEIVFCKAEDKYTEIYVKGRPMPITSSKGLSHYNKELQSHGFFSCHRSYLVNLEYARSYSNEGVLDLSTGDKVPVSRRKKVELMEALM